MIEVLFGEGDAGTMKTALSREKVFGNDVVYLPLRLDIGDISQPVLNKYRCDLMYKMLYQEQWGADEVMKAALKTLGSKYAQQLRRLNSYIKEREPLRIWYSDAPYSLCGLLWLCSRLEGYSGELWTVKLPHIVVRSDGTPDEHGVICTSWSEVKPSELKEYLPFQRRLIKTEIVMNGIVWKALERQNAPLRAVVNGSVISVPASFYDFLILKYLGDKPIREAVLIGTILGENPLGIGDWWYARRIEKLIAQNRVKIIENSPQKYARIIAKNQP